MSVKFNKIIMHKGKLLIQKELVQKKNLEGVGDITASNCDVIRTKSREIHNCVFSPGHFYLILATSTARISKVLSVRLILSLSSEWVEIFLFSYLRAFSIFIV